MGINKVDQVAIADIKVSDDRARGLDGAWVEALAGIISAEGLIQPVAVKEIGYRLAGAEDQPTYKLVAGGHRLAACRSLGWENIPSIVYDDAFGDADLIETLENLARRELDALDRAKHYAVFKTAYEAKHGPIERGGDRKSQAAQDQSPQGGLWSFHEVIADHTGFKRASIFEYLAIWNGLMAGSYDRLRALPGVAGNKGQLKKLSEQNHDRQDQALGLIEIGKAGTVDEALDVIDEVFRPSASEKRLTVARGAWSRLTQSQRYAFLADNEDEVRLFAKERGWLA